MTNADILALLKTYHAHLLMLRSCSQYNYEETREFLNKNRNTVQRILIKAGTLRLISIAPPPMFGGYMMNNINPLDIIFDPPYGMDVCSHLSDVILQAIGVIENDPDFYKKLEANPSKKGCDCNVWALIHPQIAEVSKKRMSDGYYADAVEAACKAVNSRVRGYVLDQTGEELDGSGLMKKAFLQTILSSVLLLLKIKVGMIHSKVIWKSFQVL